jgi:hypothetical protein
MLLVESRYTMSRLLLALVFGATSAAATGCYGTTASVGYDGYYDTYPYYYGAYTSYPYYSGTYYAGYPYYRYSTPYYRYSTPYYRTHYGHAGHYGHYNRHYGNYGRNTTVVRDHRSYSGGHRYSPSPGHYGRAHHGGRR